MGCKGKGYHCVDENLWRQQLTAVAMVGRKMQLLLLLLLLLLL